MGPDFIDPGHHCRVTGRASRNLDGWMFSRATNLDIFARHTAKADIAVVEGVTGLFDGYDGSSEAGSTAQMAKWLGLPVALVVDARAMARSAAALVQGYERFDDGLRLAGVLFNLDRLKALGYREITQARETVLGPAGQTMRGHEFHYSTLTDEDPHPMGAYRLTDCTGMKAIAGGFIANQTLGSYVHLHFASCPQAATHFVAACRRWSDDGQARKKC